MGSDSSTPADPRPVDPRPLTPQQVDKLSKYGKSYHSNQPELLKQEWIRLVKAMWGPYACPLTDSVLQYLTQNNQLFYGIRDGDILEKSHAVVRLRFNGGRLYPCMTQSGRTHTTNPLRRVTRPSSRLMVDRSQNGCRCWL